MRRSHGAFYRTAGGVWQPLGKDRSAALLEWARLEGAPPDPTLLTISEAILRFRRDDLPKLKPKTQIDYGYSLARLERVFGKMHVDALRPLHVRQYIDKRGAPVAANREIAVLSRVMARAIQTGMSDKPNPCRDVDRNPERPRGVLVTDDMLARVRAGCRPVVQDALDLLFLTGQRRADVLSWTRSDVRDGYLHVSQGKTGARLRIVIEGDLAAVVERCKLRSVAARSLYLLCAEDGSPLSYGALRGDFETARTAAGERWQMRDLRAKAATEKTDDESTEAAQDLLGHASITTTQGYVRRLSGRVVHPLNPSERGSKRQS